MDSVLIAANDYIGTPYQLPDCQLDGRNWRAFIAEHQPNIPINLVVERTRDEMREDAVAWRKTIRDGQLGGYIYSGHGSDPRSASEPDLHNEALVGVDGKLWLDDDFAAVMAEGEGHVMVILDSCFSGGMARGFLTLDMLARDRFFGNVIVPRYLPSEPPTSPLSLRRHSYRAFNHHGALWSASSEREVSFSTGQGGAFSRAAQAAWKDGMTWKAWHEAVTPAYIPTSSFPQHPKLTGKMLFEKVALA